MTTFEMLQELLAQNEFELLLPEDHTANTTEQDIRLVYQMNDTVESFLVFRKAIFTGTYKKDYEGKLDASYDRDQDRYVLGVRQGDSVITLFYQKLELEVNLYNYGEIAHFWVPRYENLRQLEFRIAVLWDKYTYLGENYCSEGKSAWSIWRMSRRLISALTVLHRSRIWCHMRCRKGLSCRVWM